MTLTIPYEAVLTLSTVYESCLAINQTTNAAGLDHKRTPFYCWFVFFCLKVCCHWFRSLIGVCPLLTALCVLPLMLADQGLFHLAVLVLLLGMGFYMAARLLLLRHGAAPTNSTCLCWFGLCSSVVCCTSWHVVMYGSGRNS